MPPLDPAILARRSEIVAALRAIVPGEGVIDDLRRHAALRVRCALGLSADAAGRGPARDGGPGLGHPAPTARTTRSRSCRAALAPRCRAAPCFYYAPDPSSQIACTIGGNVAENSGGVHCLKYGLTTNNVLGIEMVLMNGEIVRLGGKHLDADGYDLLGLMTGSEGLLGVVTEVTVRILRKPSRRRARCCSASRPARRPALRRRRSSPPASSPAAWR